MRITKLDHAALVVEEGGRRLVVDPGGLTNPILGLQHVDVVVITHEHADHWTGDQLRRILDANPDAVIVGPSAVAQAAADFDVQTVRAGETVEIESWSLEFFGGNHAVIHPSIPVIANVGVLINHRLYYPGDSFHIPLGAEVDTLAAPIGAPWMKISEAMDFVAQVAPKRAFGTHDGVLSAAGRGIANDRLKAITESKGGEYFALGADGVIDI